MKPTAKPDQKLENLVLLLPGRVRQIRGREYGEKTVTQPESKPPRRSPAMASEQVCKFHGCKKPEDHMIHRNWELSPFGHPFEPAEPSTPAAEPPRPQGFAPYCAAKSLQEFMGERGNPPQEASCADWQQSRAESAESQLAEARKALALIEWKLNEYVGAHGSPSADTDAAWHELAEAVENGAALSQPTNPPAVPSDEELTLVICNTQSRTEHLSNPLHRAQAVTRAVLALLKGE